MTIAYTLEPVYLIGSYDQDLTNIRHSNAAVNFFQSRKAHKMSSTYKDSRVLYHGRREKLQNSKDPYILFPPLLLM